MPPHYLQPLLAPRSVALVGATERQGALGAIVWRNLAAAGLRGELHPVNPKHRAIFGKRAYARIVELRDGHILEANHDMLQLAAHLGFVERSRDGNEVTVVRTLK